MKIFYTLFFVCLSCFAFSQITITTNDMPSSGDTLRFSVADIDTLTLSTYQQNGANITWDFSHLVPNSQDLNSYESASSTSYGFFFLGANKFGIKLIDTLDLGVAALTNIYDFYKNSSTAFEAEGRGITFSGFPVPSFYNDNDEIYQFPLDYNDYDSSTFDFTTNIPFLATLVTTGYRINNVDAYGTIVTPYGTKQCIRVVTDVISQDSVNITGLGGFSFPNHVREYKWLALGEKYPMLNISGAVVGGAFVENSVTYRDIFRNIQTFNPLAPTADFVADNVMPAVIQDTITFSPENIIPLPNNTYQWAFSPNTVTFVNGTSNTSENPEVVFNMTGAYDVYFYVNSTFGDDDTTKIAYINAGAISTNQISEAFELKVFPNPVSNGQINVTFNLTESADIALTLMNIQGQIVKVLKTAELGSGIYNEEFSLKELSGVYLLNVRIGEEQQTYRLVIE
jgi:hypothetical protein